MNSKVKQNKIIENRIKFIFFVFGVFLIIGIAYLYTKMDWNSESGKLYPGQQYLIDMTYKAGCETAVLLELQQDIPAGASAVFGPFKTCEELDSFLNNLPAYISVVSYPAPACSDISEVCNAGYSYGYSKTDSCELVADVCKGTVSETWYCKLGSKVATCNNSRGCTSADCPEPPPGGFY